MGEAGVEWREGRRGNGIRKDPEANGISVIKNLKNQIRSLRTRSATEAFKHRRDMITFVFEKDGSPVKCQVKERA